MSLLVASSPTNPAGPPTSPEEQLDRLLRRGMIIPDQDEAIRFLSNVSFYRFRGYLEPFVAKAATGDLRPFHAGTTFNSAIQRYEFDVKLRTLLLEAFNHIEISIRAQWTNHLSHHEDGGKLAHLNLSLFGKGYEDNLAKLKEDYQEHGQELHGFEFEACPIWALSEMMSFGQLSKWYGDTNLSVKKRVADHYRLHYKTLGPLLHHLSTVRNFSAHHERLWDRVLATKFSRPRKPIGDFSDPLPFFNPVETGKLYNSLVMIAYLTSEIANRTTWARDLVSLMDQHPHIPQDRMGFIPDWRDLAIWQPKLGRRIHRWLKDRLLRK